MMHGDEPRRTRGSRSGVRTWRPWRSECATLDEKVTALTKQLDEKVIAVSRQPADRAAGTPFEARLGQLDRLDIEIEHR